MVNFTISEGEQRLSGRFEWVSVQSSSVFREAYVYMLCLSFLVRGPSPSMALSGHRHLWDHLQRPSSEELPSTSRANLGGKDFANGCLPDLEEEICTGS